MHYSGIDLICFMFNTRPQLKYQRNFSYFYYENPFIKKHIILTDLNTNAEPYILSPSSNSSCSPRSPSSSIVAHFDKDIINNLINISPQSSFFSFDEKEIYQTLE